MGIYHLSAKTLKRASGRTPQASSAYRRGIRLLGPDGTIHDYRRRARGIRATGIFAPEGCDWVQDPQALWDRADAAERRQDSRTAREYEIALPAELPWAERQRLAEAFAQHLVEQFGVAVDLAIHEPAADGEHDDRNHHAHLLTTTRTVTPEGMGEKTRELDLKTTSPALIEALRAEWARMANAALSCHNAAQIDHRSHERRKLEVEPTKHEGPKVTWWRRLRAEMMDCPEGFMDRARENNEIRARNASIMVRLREGGRRLSASAKGLGGVLKGILDGRAGPPPQLLSAEAALEAALRVGGRRAPLAPSVVFDPVPVMEPEETPLRQTTDAEIHRSIEVARQGAQKRQANLAAAKAELSQMFAPSVLPPVDVEAVDGGEENQSSALEAAPPETDADEDDDDGGGAASSSVSDPVNKEPKASPTDAGSRRRRPR